MTSVFRLTRGKAPLLISFPHAGEELPPALPMRLTQDGLAIDDTDFNVPELYNFARELGASTIEPRYSRYVVDLNRPVDDAPLYPGQHGTGIVPISDFFGRPLYRTGQEPDASERSDRIDAYWRPYHAALAAELGRLRDAHGRVLLWDAHSIRDVIPTLFAGTLADLNIGTADGASAAPRIQDAVERVARASGAYSVVMNGRFTGGYITRNYGRPQQSIHAVQLEMSKTIYLGTGQRPPCDPARAGELRPVLRAMIESALVALMCNPS